MLREYLLNWAKRDGRLAYCDSAVGQLLPECVAELSSQAGGTTVDSAASRRLRTLWAHMHVLRAQLGGALAPVLAAEAEKVRYQYHSPPWAGVDMQPDRSLWLIRATQQDV